MFLPSFDYISPSITIFYNGSIRHSSVVSGILTIVSFIALFIFAVIFLIELFGRKNPTAYYYNKLPQIFLIIIYPNNYFIIKFHLIEKEKVNITNSHEYKIIKVILCLFLILIYKK